MENEELLEFFKTFANLERLKIAGLLAMQPLPAPEIARRVHLSGSRVIGHLEKLHNLGLIKTVSPESPGAGDDVGLQDDAIGRLPLMFDADALQAMSRRVLAGARPAFDAEAVDGEAYDRKVLSDFMTGDGKLKHIPSQQKKLLVVLRYLALAFQPEQRYTEKQVNAILAAYHPDTASLRRALVDSGLLSRSEGIYWKNE